MVLAKVLCYIFNLAAEHLKYKKGLSTSVSEGSDSIV